MSSQTATNNTAAPAPAQVSPSASGTHCNQFAFLPVHISQQGEFNFSELNASYQKFFTDVAKAVFSLEEISEASVVEVLDKTFKATYYTNVKHLDTLVRQGDALINKQAKTVKKVKGEKAAKAPSDKLTAPSSYLLFCDVERAKINAITPRPSATEIVKILGQRWNEASAEVKGKFKAQSDAIKAQIAAGTYVAPVKPVADKKRKAAAPAEAAPVAKPAQPAPAPVAAAPAAAPAKSKKGKASA